MRIFQFKLDKLVSLCQLSTDICVHFFHCPTGSNWKTDFGTKTISVALAAVKLHPYINIIHNYLHITHHFSFCS